MILNLKLITPPEAEPITLDLAKQHCRVANDNDDAIIQAYISAARRLCENETRRAFFNQTWQRALDHFPLYPFWSGTGRATDRHDAWNYSNIRKGYRIQLPRPSLVSVKSITYLDPSRTVQTLDPSLYYADADSEPGCIVPQPGLCWPYTQQYLPGSVKVQFVAGSYGDGVIENHCPENVQVAILLMTGHLYENREATTDARLIELPMGVKALLQSEMVEMFAYENN